MKGCSGIAPDSGGSFDSLNPADLKDLPPRQHFRAVYDISQGPAFVTPPFAYPFGWRIYAVQTYMPMDRSLLCILALGTITPAFAQPTLDFPASAPTAGTSFLVKYGAYSAVGAGGTDQTWDYASLVADSTAYVFVEDPAATPGAAQFPSATAAVVAPSGTEYFQASSWVLELVGPSLIGQTAPLTNPASYLPFPCTYQSSWEDDFAGAIDVMGFAIEVTGNVIGVADGYGTLILPEGTVNDVLRVRRVTTTSLITAFGNGEIEEDAYAFYKVGLGLPILEVSATTGDLPLLGPLDIQSLEWTDVNSVGFADLFSDAIGMEVFPNPATDMVQVNFGLSGGRTVAIELMDLSGRAVRTVGVNTANSGVHTSMVDLAGLPAGMYMLRITDDNGRVGTKPVQVL